LRANATGSTYEAVAAEDVGALRLRRLGVRHQRAIAEYLDTETARIDALIAKKQHLVSLLSQRWSALRAQELLHSLDPTTGHGELPRDWQVASLAMVARLQRGIDLPDSHRRDGSVPVVSSGGRSGWHDRVGVNGPGVITGRYGTVGSVFWEDGDFWPLNTTLYVKDFAGNLPRWVFYLLGSIPLDIDSAKSAVTGINRNVIGKLRVPRPPVAAQRTLAATLDAHDKATVSAITALGRQVRLLQEHRQALITAAVTGELEIPGAA
jgi:type I restriction enzyme S subunit